jgi:hypothetical protein
MYGAQELDAILLDAILPNAILLDTVSSSGQTAIDSTPP